MTKKEIKRFKALSIKALIMGIHFLELRINIRRKSSKKAGLIVMHFNCS